MNSIKMITETEQTIYPQEYAKNYKAYLKDCELEEEEPMELEEWLENELAEGWDFDLWNTTIENFEEILGEVEKLL